MQWESLLLRVGPILAFLVCVTIVAELADGLGVFSTLAHGAARLAQGSVLGLWLLIVRVAVTATAVLLSTPPQCWGTPVVLALARQLDLDVALVATWRLLPWQLVLGVGLLFILVQIAHDHGLGAALGQAAGHGPSGLALAQLCGVGAVGANLVDNLPSYLALEPAADASPLRLAALLAGVNAGPLITPWASLATLLWAARCRSAGVAVSWRRFAARGAVLVPLLLTMSVTSLWLAHG